MAFNGSNNLSSIAALMHERIKYQLEAYPENNGLGPPMIKHTNFAVLQLYGHVNPDGIAIYPNEDNLKDLAGSSDPTSPVSGPRALGIVAEMHSEIKANIDFNVAFGKLFPTIRSIATMTPKRAYESPVNKYNIFLNDILAIYNDEVIPNLYGIKNITSYDVYVKNFIHYIKNNFIGTPVLFSSWIKSGLNDIFSTGLAVSIIDKPFDVDLPKETFIKSGNLFDHYKRLAMNKGFSIMHNAPWCLIADLGSPAMNPFYDRMGNIDINNFFSTNFKFARNRDLELLKFNLRINYNNYITINPYIKKHQYACGKTITKIHTLTQVPPTSPVQISNAWIRIYAQIRNIESGFIFNSHRLNKIIKEALKNDRFSLDNSLAVGYIDSNFIGDIFDKPFGVNHLRKRENDKRKLKLDRKLSKGTKEATYIGGSVGSSGGMTGGGSGGGY